MATWLAFLLLAIQAVLWLSERFELFAFNQERGHALLIAVTAFGLTVVVMFCRLLSSLITHRPFQFSIFCAFLLTTASAIPCSWLATDMEAARTRRAVVEQIHKTGGFVAYDHEPPPGVAILPRAAPPGPVCLRKLLGDDLFVHVREVDFRGSRVRDAELRHLAGLAGLQSLGLANTAIDDAGLEYLKGLTQLQGLDLCSTKVSDAGVEHLKGLTQLHGLALCRTKVSDAGLESLKGLSQLQVLRLDETKVSDVGLRALEGLTQLQMLTLDGTMISDVGLKHLEGLCQLQDLFLSGTQVSDAGLEHLKGLASLRLLFLWGTNVTDAGVQRLQHALPACRIRWNSGECAK